jgi:hypothetical protein
VTEEPATDSSGSTVTTGPARETCLTSGTRGAIATVTAGSAIPAVREQHRVRIASGPAVTTRPSDTDKAGSAVAAVAA